MTKTCFNSTLTNVLKTFFLNQDIWKDYFVKVAWKAAISSRSKNYEMTCGYSQMEITAALTIF